MATDDPQKPAGTDETPEGDSEETAPRGGRGQGGSRTVQGGGRQGSDDAGRLVSQLNERVVGVSPSAASSLIYLASSQALGIELLAAADAYGQQLTVNLAATGTAIRALDAAARPGAAMAGRAVARVAATASACVGDVCDRCKADPDNPHCDRCRGNR